MLLACGIAPPYVAAVLQQEFTAEALSRLHKGLNAACTAVIQTCISHLAPALDMLIRRLGHVEGVVKWPFHFASLGMQPQRLAAAVTAACGLRATVEMLMVSARRAQTEVRPPARRRPATRSPPQRMQMCTTCVGRWASCSAGCCASTAARATSRRRARRSSRRCTRCGCARTWRRR